LIGNPVQRAAALTESVNPPSNVAVGVVLEAIEALYRQAKALRGIDAAKRELETRLEAFDLLAGIAGLSTRSTAEIAHHRGKVLNILYRRQEAEAAFGAVISGPVPLYESRLQLLRIYARDKTRSSEAFAMLEAILGDAVMTGGDVSTSVVLAAAETLSWPGLKDAQDKVLARYSDLFEERILSSAATGSEHVYQAFACIGRRWVWDDPDRFARVWASLPPKEPSTMETDQSRFAWGDTLREAAVRFGVDSARKNTLQAEALACFEAMRESSSYHERKMGQLLVEMERWDAAIAVLEGVNDVSQEPWRSYWLSKASLGRGELEIALNHVESALAKLDASNSYWVTFMQQRFDVRAALGHVDALEDLRMAHDACKDAKFKALLAARLQTATVTA
jgi:tetratricopeptide (TPR) repeat protein